MEKDTSLNISDHDASQIPNTFAITLPPSQQAPEKNVFQNKFWQGRPSPPKKGVFALMQAAGELRTFGINLLNLDGVGPPIVDIQKYIVDVLKGEPVLADASLQVAASKEYEDKKEKVTQYFKDNWETINKNASIQYHRPEKISLPTTQPSHSANPPNPNSKSVNTKYRPVHLAVIYNCKDILEEIFTHMEEDSEFCREVLNLEVETNLTSDDLNLYTKIPDEACALSTVFLCVKYNPDALMKILQIAKQHKMFDDVMNAKEMRGMNLLHFSTLNKSLECIQ